jgi:predicted nucleotidyltransferase
MFTKYIYVHDVVSMTRKVNIARLGVHVRVASLSDLIIMKAHAIAGRDKPKDVYDLCYCLDAYPGGIAALSEEWCSRRRGTGSPRPS